MVLLYDTSDSHLVTIVILARSAAHMATHNVQFLPYILYPHSYVHWGGVVCLFVSLIPRRDGAIAHTGVLE